VRLRLLSAPWWIRWIVITCLFAFFMALVPLLAAPELVRALRWPWAVVLLAVTSGLVGALYAAVTQPHHRVYLAAMEGLSATDRQQAVNAIRRGGVPAKPTVLRTAIRLSLLSSTRRSFATRQLVAAVLVVVVWIGIAILDFVIGDMRQGVFWLVVAVIFGAATFWDRQRRQRMQRNVDALRAAATERPGVLDSTEISEGDKASLRRANRIWAVGVIVILVGFVGVVYVLSRTSPDCRVGRTVIVYLNDHKNFMDPTLIGANGPPLAEYQNWSNQLRGFANVTSDQTVASDVRRISELSAQAVGVVRDARATAEPEQLQRAATYQSLMKNMTDEMWAIVDVCRFSVKDSH
jgi:hypothetical protein